MIYPLQIVDEIYYIVSGTGIMKMNNESLALKAVDAVLTRPRQFHKLQQTGNEDLVIIINHLVK